MFDFESLIGQDKDVALEVLKENGYNNIRCEVQAKHNDLCDKLIVIKAEKLGNQVVLWLGEFYCEM